MEFHSIYGSGHRYHTGVSLRRNGGANIHPVQQTSAHQIAQPIGVVGQDKFTHDGLRGRGGFAFEVVAHVFCFFFLAAGKRMLLRISRYPGDCLCRLKSVGSSLTKCW